MLQKNIKILMTIGVVVYAIALVIDIICVICQKSIVTGTMNISIDNNIFPFVLGYQLTAFLMYIVFFLVILTYDGNSKRTVGIVMLVVYSIVNILNPYINMISNAISARLGSEYLAVSSYLTGIISNITAPFVVVSTVLMLIAIGRYGIS
jgi:hypothetical protein